ncbi:hypothetical protein FSB08_27140 [Paraburkholderia sp. JPY432]|uniref:hypothetical protein n=1 Tax=Paraburkholderia youngii TaxID=2782701 RepID=UPI001595DED3|nr:hypothetical protein [Paraburkholderia youngii]NVH76102.1 hypothetical protein [Paraburkholderia youngii]
MKRIISALPLILTVSGAISATTAWADHALERAKVIDIILVITSITFTNLTTRFDDTALDFPKIGGYWCRFLSCRSRQPSAS